MTTLFDSAKVGAFDLPSRIALAPMTRCRTGQPGNIPNAMMADYYAQRASAGLIITEATQISQQGQGYSFTPGIHSEEQVAGWRKVTNAVHLAGGRIVNQLWHVGRMSHAMFHADGQPVAPSAIAPNATVWVVDPETGKGGMVDCPVPRALETDEIAGVIADYATAARNAKEARFDGIEIHAANGYLIDEFLRASSNKREDQYGGSVENRIRFAIEVTGAAAAEFGADRVGIRISPFITQRGMDDPDAPATILAMAKELGRIGIAYIHIAEADWDDAPETPRAFREALREVFPGAIVVAGGYDKNKAEAILAEDLADVVAFGRPFIANPDLPRRYAEDLPLAAFDGDTLFGGDQQGYTTYGNYEAAA
ncbi:alkene reductase [Leisingera sp. ANG59]|uniref:alkene reductase n=1 Tax=Leisingera sp. ANG59 TaxID=2675221 RepID=UPI001574319B|nr:alkene reductase [Leisingera sp. ANG59]NSY40861.1 N-ethylmaleimide reductase [Leisingera sp. ANG59]